MSRRAAPMRRKQPWITAGIVVAQYFGKKEVGVFVRNATGVTLEAVGAQLAPYMAALEARLDGVREHRDGYFLQKKLHLDSTNEANWDRMADWLKNEADNYEKAISEIVGAGH